MTQSLCDTPPSGSFLSRPHSLPLAPLLALALGGFVTILTKALPAGLLIDMSTGLNVSEASVGQLVTAYALGSLTAAIPSDVGDAGPEPPAFADGCRRRFRVGQRGDGPPPPTR